MKIRFLHLQSMFTVIFCVFMSFAFSSCSDDDGPDNNSIVGTWLYSEKDSSGSWFCQYNFKSNGEFEVKDWGDSEGEPDEPSSYEEYGTWEVLNDLLTLKFNDGYNETYRFVVDGNRLIIYDYEVDRPNIFYRR